MPCDIQKLIDNAKCIQNCLPQGMQMPALIFVFCNAATPQPPTPCVNLIPDGATYDGTEFYNVLTLLPNTQYTLTSGANEQGYINTPDGFIALVPGQVVVFTTSDPTNLTLRGPRLQPVTATICPV